MSFSLAERMRVLDRRSGRHKIFKQKKESKPKQAAVLRPDLVNCQVLGEGGEMAVSRERTGRDPLGTRVRKTWYDSLGLGFLSKRKWKM